MKTLLALLAFAVSISAAMAADLDEPYPPPPPAYAYPPPPPAYNTFPPLPPAYAYRPPGSPPSVVFFAPNPTSPSRCLPGLFSEFILMAMGNAGRGNNWDAPLSLATVLRVYPQVRSQRNTAIRERYNEDASCRAIADELGLSVRTVQRVIYGRS